MADRVDDGVEARRRLSQHGRELRRDRREEVGAPKLTRHGDGSVRTPGQQPQANVGDGHLGNPDFRALGVLVLVRAQALHVHLLGLCLERPLVTHYSVYNLGIEEGDEDHGDDEARREEAEDEALVHPVLFQVVKGAGQEKSLCE